MTIITAILGHDAAADLGLVGQVPPTPNNQRGIEVTRRAGDDDSDPAPNILLACAGCGAVHVFRTVEQADIDADLRGTWACPDCEVRRG